MDKIYKTRSSTIWGARKHNYYNYNACHTIQKASGYIQPADCLKLVGISKLQTAKRTYKLCLNKPRYFLVNLAYKLLHNLNVSIVSIRKPF